MYYVVHSHDTGYSDPDRIDLGGPSPLEKSTPNRKEAYAPACGFVPSRTHMCVDAGASADKVMALANLKAGTTASPPLTSPEIGGLHGDSWGRSVRDGTLSDPLRAREKQSLDSRPVGDRATRVTRHLNTNKILKKTPKRGKAPAEPG